MLLHNVVDGFVFHIYRYLFHSRKRTFFHFFHCHVMDINSFYEPKRILNDKRDLALYDLDYGFGSFYPSSAYCGKSGSDKGPEPNRNQKEQSNKKKQPKQKQQQNSNGHTIELQCSASYRTEESKMESFGLKLSCYCCRYQSYLVWWWWCIICFMCWKKSTSDCHYIWIPMNGRQMKQASKQCIVKAMGHHFAFVAFRGYCLCVWNYTTMTPIR